MEFQEIEPRRYSDVSHLNRRLSYPAERPSNESLPDLSQALQEHICDNESDGEHVFKSSSFTSVANESKAKSAPEGIKEAKCERGHSAIERQKHLDSLKENRLRIKKLLTSDGEFSTSRNLLLDLFKSYSFEHPEKTPMQDSPRIFSVESVKFPPIDNVLESSATEPISVGSVSSMGPLPNGNPLSAHAKSYPEDLNLASSKLIAVRVSRTSVFYRLPLK